MSQNIDENLSEQVQEYKDKYQSSEKNPSPTDPVEQKIIQIIVNEDSPFIQYTQMNKYEVIGVLELCSRILKVKNVDDPLFQKKLLNMANNVNND